MRVSCLSTSTRTFDLIKNHSFSELIRKATVNHPGGGGGGGGALETPFIGPRNPLCLRTLIVSSAFHVLSSNESDRFYLSNVEFSRFGEFLLRISGTASGFWIIGVCVFSVCRFRHIGSLKDWNLKKCYLIS